MVSIQLSHDLTLLLDDIDLDLIQQYRWHAQKNRNCWYAKRTDRSKKKPKTVYLHRIVLERTLGRSLTETEKVDHVNTNGLDNKRENLRLATTQQNGSNGRRSKNNTSGYKGVHFHKPTKRWAARITKSNKCIHLGYFDDPSIAHEAYKNAAIELFGEFARFE